LTKTQEIYDDAEAELVDAEGDVLGRDEVEALELESLANEERGDIAHLLGSV
jgi:hypothetical protein